MSSSLPSSSSALHIKNNSADGNNNSIIDPSVGTHKTETTTTNTYNTRSNQRKRQAATPTNTSSNSSSGKPKRIKNYHPSRSSRNTKTLTPTTKEPEAEKANSDDSNLDGTHDKDYLDNLNLDSQHETRNTGMANGKILRDSGTSFFSAVYEEMKKLKNEAIESEEASQYENFFETIKNTPYLYDCKYNPNIKTNVDAALGIIQDISNLSLQIKESVATKRSDDNDNNNNNNNNNNKIETAEYNTKIGKMDDDNDGIEIGLTLAERERDIYSKLDSSGKKGFIAVLKQREVEKKEREVEKKINFISDELVLIQNNTIEVSIQLHALAGLNQADGSCTLRSTISNRNSVAAFNKCENRGVKTINPEDLYSKIFLQADNIERALNGLEVIPTGPAKDHLNRIARNFNDFLSKTEFLDGTKEYRTGEYKRAVQEGLVVLERKFAASSAETNKKDYYAPGAAGHEVEGTQPYMKFLLNAIGQFRNFQSSNSSPAKSSVFSEVPIPAVSLRKKRIVDFLLRKDSRWEAVVFDDMLTIPIEVKPGRRGYEGPLELLNQATEQCVSHLAKSVYIGFNLAKYGVPSHATGIVANMAALRVLHLKYDNVGSPDVKLKLYQSELLPLMNRKNYQKWAKSAGGKSSKKFQEFENDLFGSKRVKGKNSRIPKGLIVLFNLMCKSSRDLYGLNLVPTEEKYLDELIGFGTSSVVFRQKSSSNVIKLSRYGYPGDIQHERKFLQRLKQDSNECHKNLSFIAEEWQELKVKFGMVEINLPALAISPAGKPATLFFSSEENTGTRRLEESLGIVYTGIKAALDHLHENKFVHGDVAPKNIILVEEENRIQRAVLIDFSHSSKKGEVFSTFRGTTNYVHREIFVSYFNKSSWKTEAKHDFAGLGFTLAYLANKCICPCNIWNFPKYASKATKGEDDKLLLSVMEDRFNKSRSIFQQMRDQDLKSNLEILLKNDELLVKKNTKKRKKSKNQENVIVL